MRIECQIRTPKKANKEVNAFSSEHEMAVKAQMRG